MSPNMDMTYVARMPLKIAHKTTWKTMLRPTERTTLLEYEPLRQPVAAEVGPRDPRIRRTPGRDIVDVHSDDQFIAAIADGREVLTMAFMTAKEKSDYEFALKARQDGRIRATGPPFEAVDVLRSMV